MRSLLKNLLLAAATLTLLGASAQAHAAYGRHASFGHASAVHGAYTHAGRGVSGHRRLHRGAVVNTGRGVILVIPRRGKAFSVDRRSFGRYGSRFERRHFGSTRIQRGRSIRYGHRGWHGGRR